MNTNISERKVREFYEMELKALITQDQYNWFLAELPKKMKIINKDKLHTTRYRPGDLRLRHSEKLIELILKDGTPTDLCRKEIIVPLDSMDKLQAIAKIFEKLGFKADPPWLKNKTELLFHYKGEDYVICLQHIEDFAYILEVEYVSEDDVSAIRLPYLKQILRELGLEPVNPIQFMKQVDMYIKNNN